MILFIYFCKKERKKKINEATKVPHHHYLPDRVAYRFAKSKKPHTIGETLIKPCALEMVELVCGLEQRKKLEAIPLSNDVIQSRIVEISCNILKQIINELKASPFPFSMQLDETTDISNCSQLLVFVRYVSADTITKNNSYFVSLFCKLQRQLMF
ncbi:protein ZBED8 [Nephila pilipes]|uniref:Protein ZBED8 n=1 Tax=Nephila pilipes TaxID=299642 RepID=A0A8X6MX19_NEPPI|nr:protein ZBED8 [Nephila pilipes]